MGPTGSGAPGASSGGVPINIERQRTSLSRLKMEWDYPVYVSAAEHALEEGPTGGTVARSIRRSLPREKAFASIAGEDPRPLLVLRECTTCNGTDYALLSRSSDNERTLLMARWFHCVKLPNDVLEEDHPFTKMWKDKAPPHLFLCAPDGSNVVSLDGQQSRKELWKKMEGVLRNEYKRDPVRAVKNILKVFVEYDHLDSMEDFLTARLEVKLENDGPKSAKVRKIRRQIAELQDRKEKAQVREAKASDLDLIRKKAEVAEPTPAAAG